MGKVDREMETPPRVRKIVLRLNLKFELVFYFCLLFEGYFVLSYSRSGLNYRIRTPIMSSSVSRTESVNARISLRPIQII